MAKFPVYLGEYRFSASVSARRKGGGGRQRCRRQKSLTTFAWMPLPSSQDPGGAERTSPGPSPGHLADVGCTVPELPEWDRDRDPRDPGIIPSSPAYFLMCHPPVASGMQSISGE